MAPLDDVKGGRAAVGSISFGPIGIGPDTFERLRDSVNAAAAPNTGRKNDAGKPRWSLVPERGLEEVVKVLTYGARKYGDDNWREVEDGPRRYYDAAMRHLMSYRKGEWTDEESGMPHLAHAVASLLFIMALEREGQ